MNSAFWKNKRVFVTGHTGFKGSWLSLWLQQLGAIVTGYSLKPPTTPNLFEVANVVDNMTSIEGDVRDLNSLKKALSNTKPEIVIHMAAQSLVRPSYDDPIETYETNVMGTLKLFEAVRHQKSVKAVLNVTSDKCYENLEWEWGYRENDALGGYDPYSNSKGCSEMVTAAFRSSFFHKNNYHHHGVAIASARAGNVIGGGDWATDRLIPDIFRSICANQDVLIRNPKAIRPWQHVLEPLGGYLLLLEKLYLSNGLFSEAWNFGPEDSDAKPVEWITKEILQSWKKNINFKIEAENNDLHEANFLKLDCSKAKTKLHWSPHWDIKETINRVCLWYQAFLDKEDMKSFTINQILDFEKELLKK